MRSTFLLLSLLPVAGCSLGGVTISVRPDLAGTVSLVQAEFIADASPPGGDPVKGARFASGGEIRFRASEYEFANLADLSVGDIRFRVQDGTDTLAIEMVVPTAPGAGWIKALDITEEKVRKAKEAFAAVKGRPGPFALLDPGDLLRAGVEVELPFPVIEEKIIAPARSPPPWLAPRSKDGKVGLSIPIEDIFGKKVESVTVRIVCSKKAVPPKAEKAGKKQAPKKKAARRKKAG